MWVRFLQFLQVEMINVARLNCVDGSFLIDEKLLNFTFIIRSALNW